MNSGKNSKGGLVLGLCSNTETARVCTRVPAAAVVPGGDPSEADEQTDCKFGGGFSLDFIDPPLVVRSGNQMQHQHQRGSRKVSEWSSAHSEQSAGDASSTRDCSTTECGEEQAAMVGGAAPVSDSLKGRRGVLCLGASKVESIKRETRQKKAALEEEGGLNSISVPTHPSSTPQLGQAAAVKRRFRTSTPLLLQTEKRPLQRPLQTEKRLMKRPLKEAARIGDKPFTPFGGFAGPRVKSSPSPTSVPIPVFDSSD
eukprot:Protomagalhaensia_wolfi_Nauph_80__902@NODE_151_length_3407_cov_19_594121_g112_i0_p1_GENE_NODE_151_length_3407_cov_19_594121_g112_i0NODE_151_length_3407_cov_19_594121_g112_i0_p1_ORF_typecomplete_len256_score29_97PNRC/PF15365_6/1_7_NODE_151_length_3407_cov_19_594121_g112_i023813148